MPPPAPAPLSPTPAPRPLSNHAPTADLQALDAAHHLHPFPDSAELNAKGARVITRAEGVWLEDRDGARILDGMAGLWCVAIGYGRDELADVAARQMRELPYYNTFFQTTHPPAIALAARLADVAPDGFNKVFFAGSGSEANDTNIRIARHYWATLGKPEKSIIISRKNGYHGSTMGGASLGGMGAMHAQGGLPLPDITHIDQPYWYREGAEQDPDDFGRDRARQLEEAIDRLGEQRVAAFIAEPVQGAGGVIIPPDTYWPEIQRICADRDILLITDEVICAFGRLGHWFGCESYGVTPDIMTFAKAVTSGYQPLGGSLVADHVADALTAGGEFFHGYTYSGHPVAAAVALENMRILDEEALITAANADVGAHLRARWASLAEHPLVGEARMRGMMGAIELTPDKAARADFRVPEGTIGLMCRERCFANGLVMRHVRDSMILSPPLTITCAEIDILIERAWKSLDETLSAATATGLMRPKA